MKTWLEQLYRKYANFFNRFPILNRIKSVGRNNTFQLDKPMIRSKIMCVGNNNRIVLMPGGGLKKCSFLITGDNNEVYIGNNSTAISATMCMEDSGNKIKIGNNCKMCGEILFATCEGTEITLGDELLCSSKIELRTSDSHSIFNEKKERINISKNIRIGDRVWIGTSVHINKGVSIDNDSVVGNGSVVTKSYKESNVIIAGNPAKIIRQKITWTNER